MIELRINDRKYRVEVKPNETLLDVLRDRLQLTGTKKGCDTGDCGACTVILDGRAVNACLVLAIEADGSEVLTIEGLARGAELHPLQKAFIEYGSTQCGYCTPGMILTAKAFLDENPHPSLEEVKSAIAGNLCRCTGYVKILEAISAVAQGTASAKGA